jgi:glycosyltransferase involved in cell wall biosynthesis
MRPGRLVLISGKDVLEGVGGHATYVRAHALAASRAGLEPHLFSVSPRAGIVRTEFGVVHRVAGPLGIEPPVALQVPLFARAVASFLASRPGPHLIHGFGVWAAAGAAASRLLARRGIRAVPVASAYGTRAYEVGAMQGALRAHHGLAHRLRYRAWLRWIRSVDDPIEGWGYSRSRLVLVNYNSVRKILTDSYGSDLRIRRLPYAILEAETEPDPPVPGPIARLGAPDAPLVLAVSRHDPRKGLDVLLLALAELAAAGVEFRACIVGPGRLLTAHRRLAAELGLSELVAIPGRVEDVGPYYRHASCFVLPSLAEASGSVSVLESLRAGTAVIASACDGLPEDLVHGEEALLVAPGDVQMLTASLSMVLRDPRQRARLAAGARRAHEEKFSVDGFVAALAGAYDELARTASAT